MVSYHPAPLSLPEHHTPDYEKKDHKLELTEGVENGEGTWARMETEQSPKM